MHTQNNGQTRIIAYGIDPATGNYVPLSIQNGALSVVITSPIPLPVSMPYTPPVNYPRSVEIDLMSDERFTVADDATKTHTAIFTLDILSTCALTLYAKIFAGQTNYPIIGTPPTLQYLITPNVPYQPTLSAPLYLDEQVYMYFQTTPGALTAETFQAGTVYVNLTFNEYA